MSHKPYEFFFFFCNYFVKVLPECSSLTCMFLIREVMWRKHSLKNCIFLPSFFSYFFLPYGRNPERIWTLISHCDWPVGSYENPGTWGSVKQQCQSEGRDGMGGERRGKVKRESWHHCLEREFNGVCVCVPVCRCVLVFIRMEEMGGVNTWIGSRRTVVKSNLVLFLFRQRGWSNSHRCLFLTFFLPPGLEREQQTMHRN